MPKPAEHRGITPARVAGVCGTGALLGAGVAVALMIAGAGRDDGAPTAAVAATATPRATATPARTEKRRPSGPSRRARAARRAAVADVNAQGWSPVRLGTYRTDRELRVLIAAPTGDRDGGRRAFFFVNRRFVGTDTADASARVTVERAGGRRWLTLRYRLYGPADRPCCPTGDRAKVRFTWDGTSLRPVDALPAAELRAIRR